MHAARVPCSGTRAGATSVQTLCEKDEWLNVAFGNDANEFTESASDMKSRISVVDRLEFCWPAPQSLHDRARASTYHKSMLRQMLMGEVDGS